MIPGRTAYRAVRQQVLRNSPRKEGPANRRALRLLRIEPSKSERGGAQSFLAQAVKTMAEVICGEFPTSIQFPFPGDSGRQGEPLARRSLFALRDLLTTNPTSYA